MVDFIGRTKCPDFIVEAMLEFFWLEKQNHAKGHTATGINEHIKTSTDLICYLPHLEDIMINKINVFKDYALHLEQSMDNYAQLYPSVKHIHPFALIEPFNIQWYKKSEGYKEEHCERVGIFNDSMKRCLVFMTYLNDVEDGGTKFKYYNHIEKAEKGKTLIWPADWTHAHCGQVTDKEEKFIATGWFSHVWDFHYK